MANLSASDLAGRHIRQARERRKWTAKDLAARCAEVGAPRITATVVTNLETRRRASREISVDELLVLAYVLELPPIYLISPTDGTDDLQITSDIHKDAIEAAYWLAADEGAPSRYEVVPQEHDFARLNLKYATETSPLRLLRLAARAVEIIRREDKRLTWTREHASDKDQLHRPDMRRFSVGLIRQAGLRLAQINAWMEGLGHTPTEPPSDVVAILAREGVPGWRQVIFEFPEILDEGFSGIKHGWWLGEGSEGESGGLRS